MIDLKTSHIFSPGSMPFIHPFLLCLAAALAFSFASLAAKNYGRRLYPDPNDRIFLQAQHYFLPFSGTNPGHTYPSFEQVHLNVNNALILAWPFFPMWPSEVLAIFIRRNATLDSSKRLNPQNKPGRSSTNLQQGSAFSIA